MKRLPTAVSPLLLSLVLDCLVLLALGSRLPLLFSSPQADHPRQKLHSVLSQAVLTPPLRSPEGTLRFSPNGKYLLLQDASGVAILSTAPLGLVFHIPSGNIYPAQFSAESDSVTVVSRGLSFSTWKLPAGLKVAGGDLHLHDECTDGQLSPGAKYFACVTPDFSFSLAEISTQKIVFEDSVNAFGHLPSLHSRSAALASRVSFFSLDMESSFAKPFGLVRTSTPRASPGHVLASSSIYFSADAKLLLVNSARGAFGLDIPDRKKFDVSDRFKKVGPLGAALQSSDRAVILENEKEKEKKSFIISLKNGKAIANPQFVADRICAASNPRYTILYNLGSGGPSAGAFDLNETHPLVVPPNASMDIFDDLMAIYNNGGFVALYRLGERQLLSSVRLPFGALPALSSAALSPAVEQLAISVGGEGAIFQLSNGQRSGTFPKFTAANFLDHQEAILLQTYSHHDAPGVLHVDAKGETSHAWDVPKGVALYSNGPVLLEYSLKPGSSTSPWDFEIPEAQVPFRLRALDPPSGKELWKREFVGNAPTPFADPQGERLVLGWKAKSFEAKEVAAGNPAVKLIYKNAKLTDQDSFFEALDARTGKSLGGILVQVGNHPISFDSAFSFEETMVLIKDSVRISLYSLADGQLKARLVGVNPSVSAESKLLALDLGSGRLGIYDSDSGTKLEEQIFPDDIAYTHFSADGKRLFVLTEHQAAVILDVSRVREDHAQSPDAEGKN
ncbi:MAG TPA: hypothetical protein VJO16_00880 [Candidatus Acidoferrum sp.]|nr:hypothetical protein [Candidatus Acidoferrum sp.]